MINSNEFFGYKLILKLLEGFKHVVDKMKKHNSDLPHLTLFKACVKAIKSNKLISRESSKDKEYHFQNWFQKRLEESNYDFEIGGRNSYPDFRLVASTIGFELKGLAYPGRDASFDSNSQVPTGKHKGREIYYVFGRYPKEPDGSEYPVMDLVMCHGDFLNADHQYVHKNKNVKGFGSYGDIMIRDRKMYVLPTPFHLIKKSAHQHTLVIPANVNPGNEFELVGVLTRQEANRLIVGYSFDLRTNEIRPETIPNPGSGTKHEFRAWRVKGAPNSPVSMNDKIEIEEVEEDVE